jgi:hypothetical protein
MKNLCVLMPLFLTGCASALLAESKAILERYPTVVFDDGISLEESKLIAQRELIRQDEAARYDLPNPQVAADMAGLPRSEEHWFLFFNERGAWTTQYVFMVVINKKNGRIIFARDHTEDKRWVLEAALLRDNVPGKF